eukprot:SAG11_NODE_2895_length_2856_cov_2.924946_2_plen_202_part_00
MTYRIHDRSTLRLARLQWHLTNPTHNEITPPIGVATGNALPVCSARAAAAAAGRGAATAAGVTIDLCGKVALITGATGQLGQVMVRTLARAGCDIAVHYRSDGVGAEALCEEVRAQGRRAVPVYADISDTVSIGAMKTRVQEVLGNPDIVVTNAVQQYQWKSVLEQDEADYESQFRTSVMQNVLMAKHFVRAFAWSHAFSK